MIKSEIRNKILHIRKKNYSKHLFIKSNKLIKLLKTIKLRSNNIGAYYPFNYEINIINTLKLLEKKNFAISLPKISQNKKMDFYQWSIKDPLKINKYGIPETISKKKVYPNILLIPLVAYDNKLNRLGYGGGYYDRYISRFEKKKKLIKIGVGFSFQRVKSLPTNKYDKKLDYLITEKGLIK